MGGGEDEASLMDPGGTDTGGVGDKAFVVDLQEVGGDMGDG